MRSVTKTFKSLITESVNILRIKAEQIEKETFEEDEKDLINNVVINNCDVTMQELFVK